jgi:undecaprenyl-diphosphatase
MSRAAPIKLPPTRADLTIGRAALKHVNPRVGVAMQTLTWLADEKAVLAAAAVLWMATRSDQWSRYRHEADQLVVSVMVAGALPHLFKLLVRRRRPDRSLVQGRRKGVPLSGDAWDSFPSGHAVHMGAMAGSLARLSPRGMRPLVWFGLGGVAATRIMLLAHYATDVVAGWTIALLVNRTVAAAFRKCCGHEPGARS